MIDAVVPAFVLLALLASLLRATSILIDEALITDHADSTAALILTSMAITVLIGLPLLLTDAVTRSPPPRVLLVLAAQAAIAPTALLLYFLALRRSQSTLVSPLLATTPIVTIVLAHAFLHESLHAHQYLGIALVITGSIILSLARSSGRLTVDTAVPLALAAVLLWGIDAALTAHVLDATTIATVYLWKHGIATLLCLPLLHHDDVQTTLHSLLIDRPTGGLLVTITELVNAAGLAAGIAAYAAGPASLVSPLATIMVVFVFLQHALLHLAGVQIRDKSPFARWPRKLAATLLVACGVAIVTLL